MTTTTIETPAQEWAWQQVTSPNLRFTPEEALTLLGFARLADQALNAPNGYVETTWQEVENMIGANELGGFLNAFEAANDLKRAGLLVFTGRGWRIPEEAFS